MIDLLQMALCLGGGYGFGLVHTGRIFIKGGTEMDGQLIWLSSWSVVICVFVEFAL